MRNICFYIIFFYLCLNSTIANAKYIYEYLSNVEPLIMDKKYELAERDFNKLSTKIRAHAIKGTGWAVIGLFQETLKYLKEVDDFNNNIECINNDINSFKTDGEYGFYRKGNSETSCRSVSISSIDLKLPIKTIFSDKFCDYVKYYRRDSLDGYEKIYNYLLSKEKAEEEEAIKKQESERKRQIADRERLIKEQQERRDADKKREQVEREREDNKIDLASKNMGFKGFSKKNMIGLIYTTQREGNLDAFLNMTVGCPMYMKESCNRWYPKVSASQILDKGVLYHFLEFNRDNSLEFTIYVEREPGKLYQDGQCLENAFHVLTGLYTYQTVVGSTKTVPAFKKIDLEY